MYLTVFEHFAILVHYTTWIFSNMYHLHYYKCIQLMMSYLQFHLTGIGSIQSGM